VFTHTGHAPIPELTVSNVGGKRHYVTPDGHKYPSITTVLGSKEKPWLDNWQKMLGDKKAEKEKKRATDRGNAIHEMVENYLNNKDKPTKGYDAEHIRGFNKLKYCLNRIDNIRAQEVALYSDVLKVAGRVDCIGEYNGTLSIIDFKTSSNDKNKNMIDDYFKQATAYAIMWYELTGESITNISILMSVEKGMVPLVFEDSIDNWVEPLLVDIHGYYNQTN